MRIDSDGVKSPTARSCPPRRATTRLCIVSSNSIRIFLPSTRTTSAAKPGETISASSATADLWAVFIGSVSPHQGLDEVQTMQRTDQCQLRLLAICSADASQSHGCNGHKSLFVLRFLYGKKTQAYEISNIDTGPHSHILFSLIRGSFTIAGGARMTPRHNDNDFKEVPMPHTAKKLATLAAFLLALTPALVFGQASFEAQVRGVVRDSSGSVVVGARVTITDVATNISNTTTTDERGFYIFNGLHPATYILKAEASGFRPEEAKNVVLGVSQHTNIDFALQVGGVETSMTIIEASPTLETGDSAIGTTVT